MIHAGLYYPEDSLKTKLCIQGNRKLYNLFKHVDIPHKKIGKWIVAQDEDQHAYLKTMHAKANRLGVETYFLSNLKEEPEIKAYAVLVSPSTGILDSHALMDYLDQRISAVGDIALNTSVQSIRPATSHGTTGFLVDIATPSHSTQTTTVLAQRVFNCGGLHADKLSNMVLPDTYQLHYARGHYYTLTSPLHVKHLIYPCPEKNLAGLGTHLTLDMAGRVKFGPDVQYIDDPYDYSVPDSEEKKEAFASAIQTYLPSLQKEKLHPDYAGIRPKLAGPGEPFRDFIIKEEEELNRKGFFSLIGIESPGLTSSLAIADYVYDRM